MMDYFIKTRAYIAGYMAKVADGGGKDFYGPGKYNETENAEAASHYPGPKPLEPGDNHPRELGQGAIEVGLNPARDGLAQPVLGSGASAKKPGDSASEC